MSMNRKFQALRREILAFFGRETDAQISTHPLPVVDWRVVDPDVRSQRQARVYGLWERTKHITADALDETERAEREQLAEHLELCLKALDAAGAEEGA